MTDRRPKIAALIADAFQEEEYFFPKVALNEAGYEVEVVSSRKEPVEIYSYFARTGLLDVERAITEAGPRTMWASSFQVAQKALPCLPKIHA
jgi:putative intracellular protease/amidase